MMNPGIVTDADSRSVRGLAQDFDRPWSEVRLDRAVGIYGRHVISVIGEDKPWDCLGHIAIERFSCNDVVYFVGGEHGAVKIGHTKSPLRRLATMQMGSPIKLRILALVEGSVSLEREYHRRFTGQRLHGEWFERCPEIEAEITRLNESGHSGSYVR